MNQFDDFYKSFGLNEYPFSSFTTENEVERLQAMFVPLPDYASILDNFSAKTSMILTGDRGTGKTALIQEFLKKVEKSDTLICEVIDFSELNIGFSLTDFYSFLIKKIAGNLFHKLADTPKRINKLNQDEKLLLSYLLKNYVSPITKTQLKKKIEKIQIPWYKQWAQKSSKILRGIFNYGATVGGLLIDDYIAKHFSGLPPFTDTVKIKDYFPELPDTVQDTFINQEVSYELLIKIVDLCIKLKFERILVIFDRVDEDSRFSNDAEAISTFILPILTDNKLLLERRIQIIFSTWVTPYNFIKSQVRTQKHFCPTLSWTISDLQNALNKRLGSFSNQTLTDYNKLFDQSVTTDEISEVFELANRNPRDLWHIFNHLFKEQYSLDPNSLSINSTAIERALVKFVTTFNYYEYYPKKAKARKNSQDIYSYTKFLLKLDSPFFTKNQLNEKAGTGSATDNHVTGMERIGLIGIDSVQGYVTYKIKDTKIVYALKKKLEITRE